MTETWSVVAARYGKLETTRGARYHRWQAYGEPDGPARMDYFFWVVRSERETILVDSGFHPAAVGPLGRRGQFAHAVENAELDVIRGAVDEGRVTRLIGGEEIAEDVHAVHLGGHSPGQMALAVFGTRPGVILASDAVHFYEELEQDRPFGVIANLVEMYEGYDTLRELAGDVGHIVPGHDPEVMERFPRVDGAAGEFAVEIR